MSAFLQILLGIFGFVLGYAIRAYISRRRRRKARQQALERGFHPREDSNVDLILHQERWLEPEFEFDALPQQVAPNIPDRGKP
jgi:hypothetical protein